MGQFDAVALDQGRAAFARRQWRLAHARLASADRAAALPPEDLQRFAAAAYLIGKESDAAGAWARAHHAFIDARRRAQAARCGFWLSLTSLLRGEVAPSAGWLARTERLIEVEPADSLEHGYVLVMRGLHAMGRSAADEAKASFTDAIGLGARYDDPDLKTLALLGAGQVAIQRQEASGGTALLDEAMATVAGRRTSPIVAGVAYCAVIITCQRIFDLRRAREWTIALGDWCASQAELVAFRGQCLVHRAEILQLQGDWDGASVAAQQACERLVELGDSGGGYAFYRRAELHRLRGEHGQAEKLYREAGRRGYEPQPGLSLLRLAQGRAAAAEAAMRRIVGEGRGCKGPDAHIGRVRSLAAHVDIMLAVGHRAHARMAAVELTEIAAVVDAGFVTAVSAQASGAVSRADGDAMGALATLREAWATWQAMEAPYEAARSRIEIGLACRALEDEDTALIHFDAARAVFERLGAGPDLARLERLTQAGPQDAVAASLTARELEVLALVASGKTNRAIAAKLRISEHTVARHLSNIFTKVGVESRTAASAFAFEHGLI